jgi:hypothetical protein
LRYMGKIPAMGDGYTEVNSSVRGSGRVTITEAAALLGVHPNTVRGRVKAGVYDAEKVTTEHGLTWMIDRDSLVNNPLPKDSQHPPSQVVNKEGATPIEVVQGLLRPFVEDLGRVREELGAERVLREQAERERDELRRQLEALQEAPEGSNTDEGEHFGTSPQEAEESLHRRGAPSDADETAAEGEDRGGVPQESQEPSQRRSWLSRFFFGPN